MRASVALLVVPLLAGLGPPSAALAQAPWRFHHEAAVLVGRHGIGGPDVRPGERTQTVGRATWAPGVLWGTPGRSELGAHAVVQGSVANVGGGLAAGGELVLRAPLGPRSQLEGRLQGSLRVAGDRGHPAAELHPGVALVLSDRTSLRLEGELSRQDGGRVGRGLAGGLSFSGTGSTTLVVVELALAAVMFALGAAAAASL
jgi:hypothetical protein